MAGADRKPNSVLVQENEGGYLSYRLIAQEVERPTRPQETGHLSGGLFGLAPDGVCRAPDVTTRAVSSYLAVSPLPKESF